jgi:hypothetical protein
MVSTSMSEAGISPFAIRRTLASLVIHAPAVARRWLREGGTTMAHRANEGRDRRAWAADRRGNDTLEGARRVRSARRAPAARVAC